MIAELLERWRARAPAPTPAPVERRGYAVCTLPRSGSNYFCSLLQQTGVLGQPREYFNGDARRRYDDPTYPDDPRAQVERILSMGATPNGIYALKIFPGLHDLVAPHLRWTEALPNLAFVRFRRLDVLGQAISWVRAAQTGQFRTADAPTGESAYDATAIALRVRQICQRDARWQMFFARTGLPVTDVTYEDLLADPHAAVAGVADALGVVLPRRIEPAASPFRMQRSDDNAAWRRRFLTERGDPNVIDPFADPIGQS